MVQITEGGIFKMWRGMKSVMMFTPNDSQLQTDRKWRERLQQKSSDGGKYVPTIDETRKFLREQEDKKKRYA